MCMCLQCCMYVCDVHRALSNNHYLSLTLTMIILTDNRQYGSMVIYRSVIITYNNNWVMSSTKGNNVQTKELCNSVSVAYSRRLHERTNHVVCLCAQVLLRVGH